MSISSRLSSECTCSTHEPLTTSSGYISIAYVLPLGSIALIAFVSLMLISHYYHYSKTIDNSEAKLTYISIIAIVVIVFFSAMLLIIGNSDVLYLTSMFLAGGIISLVATRQFASEESKENHKIDFFHLILLSVWVLTIFLYTLLLNHPDVTYGTNTAWIAGALGLTSLITVDRLPILVSQQRAFWSFNTRQTRYDLLRARNSPLIGLTQWLNKLIRRWIPTFFDLNNRRFYLSVAIIGGGIIVPVFLRENGNNEGLLGLMAIGIATSTILTVFYLILWVLKNRWSP